MWPRLESDFPPAIKFHRDTRASPPRSSAGGDRMAIPAVVNLINRQSQLAIDIEGASTDNRARAIQWTGNRQSANQQSEIKPARNPAGAYSLFAKHSGKALIATPEGAVEQTEFDPMHAFMRFRLV